MTITQYTLADLHLSGGVGDLAADQIAWLPSLPATTSDEELRHELETKGVVHVKGVMPREFVLEARHKYFFHMATTGLLKEGSDPTDGVWRGGEADGNDYVAPANASLVPLSKAAEENMKRAWEVPHKDWSAAFCGNECGARSLKPRLSLASLALTPDIRDMASRLQPTWTSPFIFKRQMWRTNIPHARGQSIGVHYDHIFLRHGPPTALTAWVPVGDCSPLMGGLIYLEGSVRIATAIEEDFTARAKASGFSEEQRLCAFNANMDATGLLSRDPGAFAREHGGHKWLIGDYEAGDAVFHSPLMIHAASGNIDPEGRIRLSCDLRYGDRDGEYDARWDENVHFPNDGL